MEVLELLTVGFTHLLPKQIRQEDYCSPTYSLTASHWNICHGAVDAIGVIGVQKIVSTPIMRQIRLISPEMVEVLREFLQTIWPYVIDGPLPSETVRLESPYSHRRLAVNCLSHASRELRDNSCWLCPRPSRISRSHILLTAELPGLWQPE